MSMETTESWTVGEREDGEGRHSGKMRSLRRARSSRHAYKCLPVRTNACELKQTNKRAQRKRTPNEDRGRPRPPRDAERPVGRMHIAPEGGKPVTHQELASHSHSSVGHPRQGRRATAARIATLLCLCFMHALQLLSIMQTTCENKSVGE